MCHLPTHVTQRQAKNGSIALWLDFVACSQMFGLHAGWIVRHFGHTMLSV